MDDAQQLNTVASLRGGQLPSLKFNAPSIKSLSSITSGVSNSVIPRNSFKWNNLGNINGLTTATSVLDSVVPNNLDASQKAMKSSMKSMLSLAGPVGVGINLIDSGLNTIGAIAGLQLDKMDNVAASRAGVSSAGLNNTIMSIPVVGSLGGFMAGKTHKSYKSGEIDDMRGAYGGSTGDIDAAQNLGNKRFLFGKRKANRFIDQANRYNELITDISTEIN